MAKNPRAGVDIVVNEKPAQAGLRALQDSFTSTIVSLNAAMEVSSKVFGAANAVISAVVDTMSEYVELAMEQERVERRAIAAIQSKIAFTREEFDALQAANAARQQQLGISDEIQLQLQGTLASMGVAKDQLDAATRGAIGLSEAMGMGLEEAGKIAAKALTGNVAALQEYGIKAISAADAQHQLNRMFEAALQQSGTLETRLKVMTGAFAEMKTTLGEAVTQSSAAQEITNAITQTMNELTRLFSSPEGVLVVDTYFRMFAAGAAAAIEGLEGTRLAAIEMWNWFQEHFTDNVVARSMDQSATAAQRLAARLWEISDRAPKAIAAAQATANAASMGGAGGGRGGRAGGARGPALRELVGTMTIESPEQVQLRQLEAQIGEHMAVEAGLRAAAADYQRQILIEQADITRQVEMEKLDERNAAVLQKTQEHVALMKSVADQSASIMGNQIAGMVTAVVTGDKSMGEALRSFVGGIVTNLGMMLIQMGSAAVALNLLSVVPVLGKLVGAPGMGVGAGLAAIGIGAGMVALGSAMGGSRGAGSAAATPSSSGGPSSMGDPFPRGFSESASTAAAPSYNVSVSFGVVGDERRAARMIRDVLERGR